MQDPKRPALHSHAAANVQSALRCGESNVLHARAAFAFRQGDFNAASTAFTELLARDPGDRRACHGMGLIHHQRGRISDALAAFREAVARDPLAWMSWQAIADICQDETERLGALWSAANALQQIRLDPDAPDGTPYRLAGALSDCGRHAAALKLLSGLRDQEADDSRIWLHLGKSHFRLGAFKEAFRHFCMALEVQPHIAGSEVSPASFRPMLAVDAIREILAIFNSAGLKPFLAAGTLLGFIRSGQPLGHDRDVDMGILCKRGERPDVTAILRRHPELHLSRDARPGDRYLATRFRQVAIDIFLFELDGDHVCSGFSDLPGDIQWRHSAFNLSARNFHGLECAIPGNAPRYLHETYGSDWRSPDHHFCSAVRSPALYGTDPYARSCYAALKAFRLKQLGRPDAAITVESRSPVPFLKPPPEAVMR